jgi:transcriptional regulator with XRE-family HTH domain
MRDTFTNALNAKNWTAADLARAAGVSYNYARRASQGTALVGADVLAKLCAALDLDFTSVRAGMQGQEPDVQARGEAMMAEVDQMEQALTSHLLLDRLQTICRELPAEDILTLIEQAVLLKAKTR